MKILKKNHLALLLFILFSKTVIAQNPKNIITDDNHTLGLWFLFAIVIVPILFLIGSLYFKFNKQVAENEQRNLESDTLHFSEHIKTLDTNQIKQLMKLKNKTCCGDCVGGDKCKSKKNNIPVLLLLLFSISGFAQNYKHEQENLFSQPGIIIVIILTLLPVLLGVAFALVKSNTALKIYFNKSKAIEAEKFAEHLKNIDEHDLEDQLAKQKTALDFNLTYTELSAEEKADDSIGFKF